MKKQAVRFGKKFAKSGNRTDPTSQLTTVRYFESLLLCAFVQRH